MRHLDLFSGIGGFVLAAEWVWGDEHEIVAFCEIDKFCQKVLKKHWPTVPIYDDVKELTLDHIIENSRCSRLEESQIFDSNKPCRSDSVWKGIDRGTIDLITGGFPCQPFSQAGKQRGREDDRHLWPEYLRIISEVRPRWVIGENVAGIINMELDQVLSDLAGESYSCEAIVVPACAVNAHHPRYRVWIIAHSLDSTDRTIGGQISKENGIQ